MDSSSHVVTGKTVLVVDDEEVVREVTQGMLEEMGYRVITAEDGLQAIDIYSRRIGEISAVLLDMTMPTMNGEETFCRLKKLHPEVRVLISSGYTDAQVLRNFKASGAAGFLQKPFNFDRLSRAISTAVSAKPSSRASRMQRH